MQENADKIVQNFDWHTRDVDISQVKKDPHEVLSVDNNKAMEGGQIGECYFQSSVLLSTSARSFYAGILSLILTNSEVWGFLSGSPSSGASK